MDNNRVSSHALKPRDTLCIGRGAFLSASKLEARAAVERQEKQM